LDFYQPDLVQFRYDIIIKGIIPIISDGGWSYDTGLVTERLDYDKIQIIDQDKVVYREVDFHTYSDNTNNNGYLPSSFEYDLFDNTAVNTPFIWDINKFYYINYSTSKKAETSIVKEFNPSLNTSLSLNTRYTINKINSNT